MSEANTARPRNGPDSRQRLLTAAGDLFAKQGYDRTTVREIGRHADVDPTMIVRYFGGKAALYLESIRQDLVASTNTANIATTQGIERLLDRYATRGPTPTMYAAVRPHQDSELQEAAIAILDRQMVQPCLARAKAAGHQDSRLRAELITAAFAGIVLSRSSKSFPALAEASAADVGRLMSAMMEELL